MTEKKPWSFQTVSLEEIPKRERGRTGYSREILDAFLESKEEARSLSYPGIKPASLYNLLKQRVKRYSLPIEIWKRGDRIFLVRKKE